MIGLQIFIRFGLEEARHTNVQEEEVYGRMKNLIDGEKRTYSANL